MKRILMILALGAVAPVFFAIAGEESSESANLSKVRLGDHWFGSQMTNDDLKGRVTLLEFWGFN